MEVKRKEKHRNSMLQLNTPTIVSTDLVISLSSSYLIRLSNNSHAVPMLLFLFHLHASCTPHPIHLHVVHDYTSSFLLFHSATAVWLPHASLHFHFMAMLDACHYLMPLDTGIF